MLRYFALLIFLSLTGCTMIPEVAHEPHVHNPFPQLSKVAVAPFFNLSAEPTVNGRRVALSYYNALQKVPGFEVVPVGVVEHAIQSYQINLNGPEDARRLAKVLGVDAVVIGAVTDYTPFYPPRMGLQVEWYAANPCFHPIPPGYGLPWGTPAEDKIPESLIFEAEMALAREQMKTQTPAEKSKNDPKPADGADVAGKSDSTDTTGPGSPETGLPENWPNPSGFVSDVPKTHPPTCWPSSKPVLRHTKIYNGNDGDFTEALSSYYSFKDEARFGGWQAYLERSDDFMHFCCHMHISEMLSARGGADQTRVVWRWPTIR